MKVQLDIIYTLKTQLKDSVWHELRSVRSVRPVKFNTFWNDNDNNNYDPFQTSELPGVQPQKNPNPKW